MVPWLMLIISVATGDEADERQRFAVRCWFVKLSLDLAIDMEFLAMEDIVVRCMVVIELKFHWFRYSRSF